MNLIIGNSYILVVEGNNQNLTYVCKIKYIDDSSVTFIDKLGRTIIYRKDKIISAEEVKDVNSSS
jgi:hypothetical protein